VLEPIAGSVTSVVDAVMYVVLSEAEKHVPYGELVGTTECMTLYPRCRAKRGRYNRVKLYADNESHVIYGCMYCIRMTEGP
jgi:hypothetical protein